MQGTKGNYSQWPRMEILTTNHVMHFSKRVISQKIAKYNIALSRD
jgi:hypothetical protein